MYETNRYETNKWGLSNYSKELAEKKELSRKLDKDRYSEATQRNMADFKYGLTKPVSPFKKNAMNLAKPPSNMVPKPKKNPLGVATTPNSNTNLARMKRMYP